MKSQILLNLPNGQNRTTLASLLLSSLSFCNISSTFLFYFVFGNFFFNIVQALYFQFCSFPGDCNILWHRFMIYNAMEKTFYNLFSLRQPKEIHVPWKSFQKRRYKDYFPYSSINSKSNTIFESLVSILSWNNSASNDLDKNYSTDT